MEERREGFRKVIKKHGRYSPKLDATLLGAFLAWILLPRYSSDNLQP